MKPLSDDIKITDFIYECVMTKEDVNDLSELITVDENRLKLKIIKTVREQIEDFYFDDMDVLLAPNLKFLIVPKLRGEGVTFWVLLGKRIL